MATSSIPAYASPATALLALGAMETISGDISGLIEAIQKHGPAQTIQAHLQPLTLADQALTAVDMLNLFNQQREVSGVAVTHIWENYVRQERLWEHYQGGESQFMQDVCFSDFVEPTIKAAKASEKYKAKQRACIEKAWGHGWEKKIDKDADHPSSLSEKYLRGMAKLAGNGITLPIAALLLYEVMTARVLYPRRGIRSRRAICPSDIQRALDAVTVVSKHYNLEPKDCSLKQLTSYLDHGIADVPVAVPETPQLSENSNSHPVLPLTPGAQPLAVEVFYNVNFP